MSNINYDLRKIRGVAFDVDGVLSPSTIALSPEGEPLRMVNIKDGYAMQLAVKCGLQLAIISGASSSGVEVRYRGLGVQSVNMGASVKTEVLHRWMESCGLNPEEVAFVGDDVPDLPAMAEVGLSVTPHDGCPDARAAALYISPVAGGYGVARDLLEQILRAQGKWMSDQKAFGW
ncbi:MAG: HAD family hydrolase [Paramuribaculum sp.]|nr:HAD family hydrolase [Paramuribaculum sp.]